MTITKRSVMVHQIPDVITPANTESFLRELQKCAENERPRFVLDCSKVSVLDGATVHLLLSSLEAVMKCNGDLRIAELNARAEDALREAGVGRLFELYETVEDAVQSFHKRAVSMAPHNYEYARFDIEAEYAA